MDAHKTQDSITSQSVEIAVTAASSLVGYAVGGPLGAVVGGVTTPIAKLAYQVVQGWAERRKERIVIALEQAFNQTKQNDEDILRCLNDNPPLADDIISMIRKLIDSDPELDALFATVIASLLTLNDPKERKRLIVLSESIKGLNKVQMQIIEVLGKHSGILSAHDISIEIDVPEIELRNAVRDLELRGIITDNNTEPTVWELRELGQAIFGIINDMEETYGR